MYIKVTARDHPPPSYVSNLLSSIHSTLPSSPYTDCSLLLPTGHTAQVHLALLSLAWPSVQTLLPPLLYHCSCPCCLPVIATPADKSTVQLLLQLVYTGRTDFVGEKEERKVSELIQQLGMDGWDLERDRSEDVNNNYSDELCRAAAILRSKSLKESLGECLQLSPVKIRKIVNGSIIQILGDHQRRSSSRIRSRSRSKDFSNARSVQENMSTGQAMFQPTQSDNRSPVVSSTHANNNINKFTKPLPPQTQALKRNNDIGFEPDIPSCKKYPHQKKKKIIDDFQIESQFLTPLRAKKTVSAVQKSMIAPGTRILTVEHCVRFFCSICDLDITKFSKEEKESHWSAAHFSSELLRFTTGLRCNICMNNADTKADLVTHVGVKHKKVYIFLLVLPTPPHGQSYNIIAPSKFNARLQSQLLSLDNMLVVPSLIVKCDLHSNPPSKQTRHHLTTAFIEEKTGISKSPSHMFPVIKQDWFYTYSSSSPILTSLVSHFSRLGQESSGKCSYCPHMLEQHTCTSLHRSEQELHLGEGKFWCGVCSQQVQGKDKQFQTHLASHLLAYIDRNWVRQSRGPGGGKELHVFFSKKDTDMTESSYDTVKVTVQVDENVIEDKISKESDLKKNFDFKVEVKININNETLEDSNQSEGSDVTEGNKKMLVCQLCKYTTMLPYLFKRHLAGCHFKAKILSENKSDLKCDLCGLEFKQNYKLTAHIGCYHNRSYVLYQKYLDNADIIEENKSSLLEVTVKDDETNNASLEDVRNLNSSAGLQESSEILSYFAQI